MARPHRNKKHEEHPDEGWLLPYSDMMTLLLALFIVMFAVSSVDKAKYNAFMDSMYTAFGGTTDTGSATPLPYPDAGLPFVPSDSSGDTTPPIQPDGGSGTGDGGSGFGVASLYLSLNDYVESENLGDSIQVDYQGEDVLVTLKNDVFFQPGSADVSQEMVEQAHTLAKLLQENQDPANPFDVIVAGHTDDVPINNAKYPSNWYLSVQRAVNFLVVLLDESSLDPTHFSTRGYGEYAPVASNGTAEGRQQNRRVELLISQRKLTAAQ